MMRRMRDYAIMTAVPITMYIVVMLVNTKVHKFTAKRERITHQKLSELDLVIGIPSVKRPRGVFYLGDCIRSLLDNRAGYDRMMIVVFLADENLEWVTSTKTLLYNTFTHEVENDLIRVSVIV